MIISLIEHYIMQASNVSHTPIKATLLELTMPNRNLIDERPHILTEFCNRKQLLIEADGINFFFSSGTMICSQIIHLCTIEGSTNIAKLYLFLKVLKHLITT